MDFWAAIQVVRRRWYVVLSAFVVSIALALVTYIVIPTQYASSGVAVLTSPANGPKFSEATKPQDVEKINPLLAFDASLTTTAEIMGQVLRDPATQTDLGAGPGAPATYTIANGDATTSGPFLFVTVAGDSPESAQGLVKRVLDRAGSELRNRQRAVDAPESTFIQAAVLVKPTVPEAKVNGKLRFAGAALVLSLIATFAAAFSVDSVLLNRRRRRDADGFELEPDGPVLPDVGAMRPQPAVAGAPSHGHPGATPYGGAVPNGPAPAAGGMNGAPQRPLTPRRPAPSPSAPRPSPKPRDDAAQDASAVGETLTLPSRRPQLKIESTENGGAPVDRSG